MSQQISLPGQRRLPSNKSDFVTGIRHVAKQQHWRKPWAHLTFFNEVPTNFVSTKLANTCAASFKATAHLKSFLNSVPQSSKSGPSIAGKASLSISSGVSGSSSFMGTEHCKHNQNGGQWTPWLFEAILWYTIEDIKWSTDCQSWTRLQQIVMTSTWF